MAKLSDVNFCISFCIAINTIQGTTYPVLSFWIHERTIQAAPFNFYYRIM